MVYKQYAGLKELVAKRTYNQKVYSIGEKDGRENHRHRIHCRHIHYKKGSSFEDIDTTLIKGPDNKWRHDRASYRPTIPEYADQWFEFYNAYKGTNHTIKAKPVCQHVKGTYFENAGTYVLYPNAFGQEIDLKVYAYWNGLRKVICVNKKPIDASKDLTFDFELQLPRGSKVIDVKNTTWHKNAKLEFTDKVLKIGNTGRFSYFRNASTWDSNKLAIPVDIQLYAQGSKLFLKKTIKSDTLKKAVYPLYTDHPTNYFMGAGDGYTRRYEDGGPDNDGNWDSCVTGNGDYRRYGDTVIYAPKYQNQYPSFLRAYCYRGHIPVETSGIDDDATITAAILNLVPDNNADGDYAMHVVQSNQAQGTSLVVADYQTCLNVSGGSIAVASFLTGDHRTITLNATARGWINKTGYTMLALKVACDKDSITPADSGSAQGFTFRGSEYADEGSDPFLDVTVEAGANPYPKSRLRKNVISGYHCFMDAYLRASREGFNPLKLPDGTVF